ncbi:AP2/B3-like transcriptional factor family protein [Striga asiatica]|uniref:AP2/B3-like transcriptional factor family protein n=1 Tax=Striga asiatica TaxID=4170 RepID=A0A5A7QW81_STRAF|nr:AP2/B3-like transcriptional factor family protein [Striga asiatica]
MTMIPGFFKVFLADTTDDRLEIPPSFTRRLDKPLPEEVHLKDKKGNVWTVITGRAGPNWLFLGGWAHFRLDNALESGDMLFFDYQGQGMFKIRIHGTNATEKEAPRNPRWARVLKNNNNKKKKKKHGLERIVVYDLVSDSETEEEYVRTAADNSRKRPRNEAKRDSEQMGRSEVANVGLAVKPKNPYFITKIMPRRPHDVVSAFSVEQNFGYFHIEFIPMEVVKDYELDFSNEITLVDSNNREFRGKVRKWGDGRVVISGGWKCLWRMNLAKEDDKVICEFVSGENGCRLMMKVSFVRAAELRAAGL